MTNINTLDANNYHSAIASWSGYVYQGKIALYHTLNLLLENDFADSYSLQLDALEDFAIIDKNGDIISLHQVKAMKSNLYNDYKEAFEKLADKKTELKVDKAFFHLAVENEKSNEEIIQDHPEIKIYAYRNGTEYFNLSEIDRENETLISEFLEKNEKKALSNNETIKLYRYRLEDILLTQVIGIHAENHKGYSSISEAAFHLTIPFKDFRDILNEDIHKWSLSQDYFCYLIKSHINLYYQEFKEEKRLEGGFSQEEDIKLSRYLIKISQFSSAEFVRFLRAVTPHRKGKLEDINEYTALAFKEEELKDAFLAILHAIKQEAQFNNALLYWNKNEHNYIPSGINANGDKQRKSICNQIVKNVLDTDIDVPFEHESIITSEIDAHSIFVEANNINYHPEEETENRVDHWKEVRLISLENAKNQIDD